MSTRDSLRKSSDVYASDLIKCIICGKSYKLVCAHAKKIHGISSRDYKIKSGLPLSVGVIGPTLLEKNALTKEDLESRIGENRGISKKGIKRDYMAPMFEPLSIRAKRHRDNMHKAAVVRWEEMKDEFTNMWINGVSVKKICAHFNINYGFLRQLRDVYGLPSRVFANWQSFYITRCGPLPTVREARKERFCK